MIDKIEIQKFAIDIEKICKEQEMNYIEAIVQFCEAKDIDIETVIPYIEKNSSLKNKLYEDAQSLNLVKKSVNLPF